MLDFIVGNDFLSSILAFALVLIPAIIIHEIGHFLAARLIGITVLEFGIGFPPRIARLFTWRETEFTLNWLPFGGFVRPLGEDMVRPLSEEELERDKRKLQEGQALASKAEGAYLTEREELHGRGITKMMAVHEAKPIPRIFFLAAGALANFVSAVFMFILIGLTGVPQDVGARLQLAEVPAGSLFDLPGVQAGDLIEQVNGSYFERPGDFFAAMEANAGQETLLTMRSLESGNNYELRIVPNTAPIDTFVRITSLQADSPALEAKLQPDDLITAVNGISLADFPDPVAKVQQSAADFGGRELMLTILRAGETLDIVVVPRTNLTGDQGRIGIGILGEFASEDEIRFLIGRPQQGFLPLPLSEAVQFGLQETAETFRLIGEIPSRIIQGTITAEEARPVSIVGISQVGGQFLQQSIEDERPGTILNFMALISIFLGITQLLPIPALDGGRILFVLIEIVRGRPIAPEREGVVHLVGIVVLLSIGIVIMIYDVINPFVLPQ